jgi:hypothetical protein
LFGGFFLERIVSWRALIGCVDDVCHDEIKNEPADYAEKHHNKDCFGKYIPPEMHSANQKYCLENDIIPYGNCRCLFNWIESLKSHIPEKEMTCRVGYEGINDEGDREHEDPAETRQQPHAQEFFECRCRQGKIAVSSLRIAQITEGKTTQDKSAYQQKEDIAFCMGIEYFAGTEYVFEDKPGKKQSEGHYESNQKAFSASE